jgi:hypothetical protein
MQINSLELGWGHLIIPVLNEANLSIKINQMSLWAFFRGLNYILSKGTVLKI